MSYVKAIFGNVISEDVSLTEGQIGFTEKDHHFKDLVKRGIVKLFPTLEEAEAFEFISSRELFNQSYKSLNPEEGTNPEPSKIDWEKGEPVKIDGVPANYVKPKKVEKAAETPVPKVVVKNDSEDAAPVKETTPVSDDKKK